jgi:pimeloyl-ACP methyl ester carboxylesterase
MLVVFHGNADLATWWVPWAREAARRTSCDVLLAEYRGYAGLGGDPTYERSALDAHAAWDAATRDLGVRAADIALMGHSLGSAIATELASTLEREGHPPRALLLQSPFTSARGMARIIVARPMMLLWDAITRVHFDTEARVRTLDVPVHVAHGERDLLIPIRMGRAVHAAARMKGGALWVPGAGHNDVDDVGGEPYWRWVEGALVPERMRSADRAERGDTGAGQAGRPARP